MTSRFQKELDVACIAVQHCAVLTQRLQRETLSQDEQVEKGDLSPVTIGDFSAQALLTSATHCAFPDDRFLAEESADDLRSNASLLDHVWNLVESVAPAFKETSLSTPSSKDEVLDLIDLGGKNENSKDGRLWVFDPIDGTASFLRGQQYAINCAFLVDGKEEIGIIGCPNVLIDSDTISEDAVDSEGLGVMIFAVRGEGTWVRPMQNDGKLAAAKRIPRHGEDAKLESLKWSDCSAYTSTILPLHQQVAAKLGTSWPGVDLFSSLMKYAALGLGRSDLVVRIFKYTSWRSNMWDHAGGVLIFEEVGGKVTDLDGNSIDFTQGRKMAANYGLVCAPSSVHAHVLELARQVIEAHVQANGPMPVRK
ncbi:related to myo-inositol-1(or 4)-monophosphatase [Ramularia collo-cygni]|uniref:Related to myo-inositol-1(Or 4)-monophosphatase n=1 Tax=Ramularia collo-cygni TaxID=112498 RepID=A0A2D3V124_9PEZI|nr:related to myo-inositol-1(or 4)-monophosphatase [Ramularia collo-cygni]CZT24027.1 related to myo-inositol-1(or 4)-monophosphatase [Ramularia collo-cygni]